MHPIRELVARHKEGEPVGITSVCSAHPLVIEATFEHALRRDMPMVLIEATSNQVNQDGGYTGMVPADFRSFVEGIAQKAGFDFGKVVLGGDHLGPNAWTSLTAAEAMAKAERMVADYVRAGFGKIHLDCSMSCSDDPVPLPETTIAERAARLCRACETAYDGAEEDAPVYVIGTEVPVPGGAAEDLDELAVTDPDAALATIEMHRKLFAQEGLGRAWQRVVATVVQPGVEFDHDKVIDYDPDKADDLRAAIEPVEHIVFEAHSTDYQPPAALAALVRDHFAILKVGPGVTFALREALWGLDAVEKEWIADDKRADLRRTALRRMRENPANWQKYYHESGDALELQLQFSLSDRIRYYWPDEAISAAQDGLIANLRKSPPPIGLISQYLPIAYAALRERGVEPDPESLILAHVGSALDAYYGACHPNA